MTYHPFTRFLLLFLFSYSCYSQTTENELKNKLGIKIGYLGFSFRDRVISTYLYQGGTVPIQMNHGFSNEKFRSNAVLSFSTSDSIRTRTQLLNGFSYKGQEGTFVQDTIGYLDHQTVEINYLRLEYELLRKLDFIKSEKFQFFLGGGFHMLVLDKKFLSLFYTNSLRNRFYSLLLSAGIEYAIHPKHTFKYAISTSVFNRVHRTLHLEEGSLRVEKYRKWAVFNSYQMLNNQFTYQFKFARRWSLEALYQYSYLNCSFPRKEQMIVQSITAGINFHF